MNQTAKNLLVALAEPMIVLVVVMLSEGGPLIAIIAFLLVSLLSEGPRKRLGRNPNATNSGVKVAATLSVQRATRLVQLAGALSLLVCLAWFMVAKARR